MCSYVQGSHSLWGSGEESLLNTLKRKANKILKREREREERVPELDLCSGEFVSA
jgi:hypothetical protein